MIERINSRWFVEAIKSTRTTLKPAGMCSKAVDRIELLEGMKWSFNGSEVTVQAMNSKSASDIVKRGVCAYCKDGK